MEEASTNLVLPPDLLYTVLRWLPPLDLRTAVLVCRRWREVGQSPGLWTWLALPQVTGDNMATVVEMLGVRRLQGARTLSVREAVVSEELLEAVASHQGLRLLDVDRALLSCLDPGMLARTLATLQQLWLWNSDLTCQQAEALLAAISSRSCPMTSLHMGGNIEFSGVEPLLLARTVVHLEDIMIWGKQLTLEQAEAIFVAVCEGCKVRRLSVRFTVLSLVEPALLARALTRLESVDLANTQLGSLQLETVLTAIATENSKLRILNLGGSDLSLVSPGLLARAVVGLEEVTLGHRRSWHHSCLAKEQVEEVLVHSLVARRLRRLDLGCVRGRVGEELVTRARQAIHWVSLEWDGQIY